MLFFINYAQFVSYLLIAEFIWLVLYTFCFVGAVVFDLTVLLNFNLFILIFSGLEFAVGLLIYYFL
jgi:hypothetical protein